MDASELPDLGPWSVVEKLGEGGQCAVFHVRHTDGRDAAVKVMFDRSPHALDRFVAEAHLLMALDHPNIVKVHEIADTARPPWIVMQLLAGKDLDEEIQQGPLETERAARVVADIADGLAAVHDSGFRHRDIKPSNIVMAQDGVPRLIDFGIARAVGQAHLTQQGMVIGTIAYMPPELFDSDDPQGVQDSVLTDVYALGQTLYEALVGEPAYPRDGSTTKLLALLMREKLERDFLDPHAKRASVPPELAAIVRDATARDPAQRIPTAADLQRRLRDWLAGRVDMNTAPVSRVDPNRLPGFPPAPPPKSAPSPAGRVARPPPAPNPVPATPPPPAPAPASTPAPRPAPAPASAPPPPAGVRPPPMPSLPGDEPPAKSSLGVWLLSGVGIATVVVLLLVVTGGAVGALWMWRPAPVAATAAVDEAAVSQAIRPQLVQQKAELVRCAALLDEDRRSAEPEVVIAFSLVGGRPTGVAVESSGAQDPAVERCLVQRFEQMTFADAPDVAVRAPIRLK